MVWTVFALSLALGAAGLVWLTLAAVDLDRKDARAQRAAAVEENARLALWRMDSALVPLIAREGARTQAEWRLVDAIPPPATATADFARLHFEIDAAGKLAATDRAAPALLARFAAGTGWQRLAAEAPPPVAVDAPAPKVAAKSNPEELRQSQSLALGRARNTEMQQDIRNQLEWSKRSLLKTEATGYANEAQQKQLAARPPEAPGTRLGELRAAWVEGELFLVRRVAMDGGETVQAVWLDWPALRAWLLAQVEDLVAGASLEPLPAAPTKADRARLLAMLPARLAVAATTYGDDALSPTTRQTLRIAWAALLAAGAALALLLKGTLDLSERRRAFVSAVTHELRTPLTTFRLYTEMLADGRVRDEAQRLSYLGTLRSEADRLSHLVANVLAYARLERGAAIARRERVSVGLLLDRIVPRLADRAGAAGMTLALEASAGIRELALEPDPAAVEQILFNLVDNAAKYAAEAADRRIHLSAGTSHGALELRVSDHGPGIEPAAAARLFRPFARSAQAAAGNAPGVGLGLALSRRLARALGGELRLDLAGRSGTSFVLRLETAGPAPHQPGKKDDRKGFGKRLFMA